MGECANETGHDHGEGCLDLLELGDLGMDSEIQRWQQARRWLGQWGL